MLAGVADVETFLIVETARVVTAADEETAEAVASEASTAVVAAVVVAVAKVAVKAPRLSSTTRLHSLLSEEERSDEASAR